MLDDRHVLASLGSAGDADDTRTQLELAGECP
jgi:hypothetical protein